MWLQPENPSELGGKIYEMMGMALFGKWAGTSVDVQLPEASEQGRTGNLDTMEAEVVEPVEIGSQK